ncbi:uncharacterized protein LOC134291715 [Aedes albopictus]|uniref:Endonuclease n=1 Tax=Aedes albopictus TaxID=7160 RepID=A0ABM1YA52_AEDAL
MAHKQPMNDSYCLCELCQQSPSADHGMVACDECGKWFHYMCANVDESIKDHPWCCEGCLLVRSRRHRSRGSSTSSRRRFRELELKRLDEEFALQQEYMRKRYEDDEEDDSEVGSLVNSSVSRTRKWIKSQREAEGNFGPGKAYSLPSIPNEGPSNVVGHIASYTVTPFGRPESRLPARKNTVATEVPIEASLPCYVPSFADPVGSVSSPHGLGRSQPPSRASSIVHALQQMIPPSSIQQGHSDIRNVNFHAPMVNHQSVPRDEQSHRVVRPTGGPNAAQLSARQVWPKRLPAFSGAAEEWPIFISSYESSNTACGFSEVENLIRLQESLKGPALEMVRSRLVLPANVPKVVETLRRVYGKPEVLIRSLISKVRMIDPPKSDRLDTVIKLGIAVQQLCDHLDAANQQDHLRNPVLLEEQVEKLPASFKLEWVRFKKDEDQVSIRTFGDFMEKLVDEASEVTLLNTSSEPAMKQERKSSTKPKGFVHTHSEAGPNVSTKAEAVKLGDDKLCATCSKAGHRARNCEEFKRLAPNERLRLVRDRQLCAVCLYSHGSMRCRNKMLCNVPGCNAKHHALLHQTEKPEELNCMMHQRINKCSVVFRVVPVILINGSKEVATFAFLDEGSSKTLLESSMAKQLGLRGAVRPLDLKWTSGVTRTEKTSMNVRLTVLGKGSPTRYLLEDVHTVERLNLPKQSVNFTDLVAKFEHLHGLVVEDQVNAEPTILIGSDNLDLMAPIESRIGRTGEPVGLRCKLGWTVSGPVTSSGTEEYCGVHQCDLLMDQSLKNYFTMEEAGITCPYRVESEEDRRARGILEETTRRVGNRFETGLLWRTDKIQMPDSYSMAYRRMQSLEQRFRKNPDLQLKVAEAVKGFVEKGYAHKALPGELRSSKPGQEWYLPLNVVVNPKKPEKIRLTLDAAAKAGGTSLNDMLLKGPDMLVSLVDIINYFRGRRIGFGGDVKEMFLQIGMRQPDTRFQKFLFRQDTSQNPDVYVMDVVIFGAKCSPCNAHFTKDINAREHADQFPAAAEAILKRHYVDDYFDSADSEDEAIQRAREVREVHSLGGFDIRNWVSNSPKVLTALGEEKGSTKALCYDKSTESERVLGLLWEPKEDVFIFTMGLKEKLIPYLVDEIRPTKRIILQCVMSFYDPVGFLSPLLVHGKIIIQETWRSGTEWDEPVTDEIFERWQSWTRVLPNIEKVKVQRCFFGDESIKNISSVQLHIFCDAGDDAYGCVAYLRYQVAEDIRCSLVGSKAKVAPLKLTSTPRLELQAAIIGARMMNTLLVTLPVPIQEQFLWVDSTTVLSWIRSDNRKYKPYVAHRIAEILHTTEINTWRYVPSKQNVADDITKWGPGTTVEPEGRWFNGPPFLRQPMDLWPEQPQTKSTVTEELRACYLFHHIAITQPIIDVARISKWKILLRTVALVYRFISNCRRRRAGLPIEALRTAEDTKSSMSAVLLEIQQEELAKAERLLWRMAQAEAFPDEVKILKKNKELPFDQWIYIEKSSELYKTSPFLDEDDVIRMEGRTSPAVFVPTHTRFPVILPKNHIITSKILEDFHIRYAHGSKETVVNEVRQEYFIPKLRTAVGKVISSCMRCRLRKTKPSVPRMAPLPIQRMQPFVRAFSYVGLDYFGPIDVTVGRRTEKRYVALFTCLVVRAVHCEVAYSLSTESCKHAIRRFISRRGAPIEIFSDNGTNFQGASRELRKEIERIGRDCANTFTGSKTKWTFNPPSAPHMGGVWERMVRSVKEAMAALSDGRRMTDEILVTTLAEAEFLVNSRPLTYSGTEDAELDTITPNHFLLGSSSGEHQPFHAAISLAEELRSSYKRSLALANEFWNRWCKEYLPTLNQRSKWNVDSRSVKVGDLVFIMDDGKGAARVRGIVEEVYTGVDGRIRQAVVRTKGGVFKRPASKLAVLELVDKPGATTEEKCDQGLWAGACSN